MPRGDDEARARVPIFLLICSRNCEKCRSAARQEPVPAWRWFSRLPARVPSSMFLLTRSAPRFRSIFPRSAPGVELVGWRTRRATADQNSSK